MNVRRSAILVPLVLLAALILLTIIMEQRFVAWLQTIHQTLLTLLSPLYSFAVPAGLVLLLIVYFSPLGAVTIGGKDTKPMLHKPAWFFIVLCTTVAAGILFWATAEPVLHFNEPPAGSQLEPRSPQARSFALSTLFLHWTFLPYSLYTAAGLMFALTYFNMQRPFQIGSTLAPILGNDGAVRMTKLIDGICLFCLVAGMSASMGSALLTLSGGLARYTGISSGSTTLFILAFAMTLTIGISAASGLNKGIKFLSYSNVIGFLVLFSAMMLLRPVDSVLTGFVPAVSEFVRTWIPRSLSYGIDSSWSENWTVFYWSNWLAWTPVTAVFLGRIARGYTIRTFIRFNLIYPSLFALVWLAVFGGHALSQDGSIDQPLYALLKTQGAESVVFQVLEPLPLSTAFGVFFLVVVFLSFVTSGDSIVSAMSGLATPEAMHRKEEAPVLIKFMWSGVIGATAWIMVSQAGLDGIRMASNLGGFPALILYILILAGLLRLLWRPKVLEP